MNIKTLGPSASQLLSRFSGTGRSIFTLAEAQAELGTSYVRTKDLLARLVRRNWLKRLRPGLYLIVPLEVSARNEYTVDELLIAARLVSPYYLSWWTALHHHGLTEQVSRKIYIGALTQARPLTLSGVTYQFVTVSKHKFFGIEDVWVQDQKVKMAGREKMLVDCLDRLDLCGGVVEAAKGLWNARAELDFERLVRYAIRMKEGAVRKRLGYLLDVFQLGGAAHRRRLKSGIPLAYSLLDPGLPNTGRHTAAWNLRLNVRGEDLLSWRKT